MLSVLLIATALATGIRFEEVACPHGEGPVRHYFKVSANTHGGYDSDLATYSTRGQFREYAVSTCPSSYFSALGSDLDMIIPASKTVSVDEAIAASRASWRDRDNPAVWERYDTAARIYRVLDRDPLTVAELYLNAAWTARDAAVGVYVGGLEGPEAARQILNVGNEEFKKNLTPEAIKLLRYNLARVAHRGGFPAERDRHLSAFLKLNTLTPDERTAGQRMLSITQSVEPGLLAHAVIALKEGLARPGDPVRLARAQYQLADLYRRLGQPETAAKEFMAVEQLADAPDELKQMARFLMSKQALEPNSN